MPETTHVRSILRLALAACPLVLAAFGPRARAQYTLTPLYEFNQGGTSLQGTLVSDAAGNLFGIASGPNDAGTVFELVNNSGSYTPQTLYSFTGGSDGGNPAALVMDASGNLYGVEVGAPSGRGGVWELRKSGGTYTFVLMPTLPNGVRVPSPTLAVDSGGNLFGITQNDGPHGVGEVWELANNGDGTYTSSTLYDFLLEGWNPVGAILCDANGNLFGATLRSVSSTPTIFELVNNGGGAYTYNTLFAFGGTLSTVDANGNVFGIAGSTVFELVNSSGTYASRTLYTFGSIPGDGAGQYSPFVVDPQGDLFGATAAGGSGGLGTVYELVNSSGTYSELILHSFTGGADGSTPGGPSMDPSGNLFVFSTVGSNPVVWEVIPVRTTLNLTSSANPIFSGDKATFTATLTPIPAGEPVAGTITFSEGSTVLGTVAVSNYTASIRVSADTLGVGSDTITAQFTPSPNVVPGSSGSITETVYANSNVALINGGNTFNGNQTVNGAVNASSFIGNGAGLSNVTAVGLVCAGCVTNAQLGINYAGSNTQGGNALNALALGGMPSSAYAVTASNSFTGDQIVNGKITATGALSGTSASFTGALSSAGLVLAPTGSATSSQAFKSGPLDASASLFNSNTGAAQNLLFRWQAEPVAATNNTASPSVTLNLLYGPSGSPAETGLSVNADGTVNFVLGQTFPGSFPGTIAESQVTNLTSDLSLNLNIAESYAASAADNAQNQAEVFANNAANAVQTNAQNFATTAANTAQTNAQNYANLAGQNAQAQAQGYTNNAVLNVQVYATNLVSSLQTYTNNTFVPLAGGTMTGALNLPSLSATGTVSAASVSSTSVSATGSLTIGGGTPITQYRSVAQSFTLPAVKSRLCVTLQTAPLSGFTPGTADTFALGLPTSFQSNLAAGKVFLNYQVWETSSSPNTTLTIQICNPTGTNYAAAGTTGAIRIDVFKH